MNKRLTRHLVWTEPAAAAEAAPSTALKGAAPSAAPGRHLTALRTGRAEAAEAQPNLDVFMAPHERAVYLLHVGAEIEHALLVQYLYAGYSLGGPHLTDPGQIRLARKWRDTVLEVAREEMGHLVTVENLLTLIGGPLSFEREDYPTPKDLYPFPFELEPLTKRSLGKYVLCEMPDKKTLRKLKLEGEIEEIEKYVGAEGEPQVNRVGLVYSAIADLFTAPTVPQEPPKVPPVFVASSDIQSGSLRFQVRRDEWGLWYKDLLIETATDRKSALAAIRAISVQGEGSDLGPDPKKQLWESHFGKFLAIYREFPDEDGWRPARNVARNPTTDPEATPARRRITNPRALLWAGLLNLRYRMLLTYMEHSFRIEAPAKASGRTPRGLLVSWAFGEMYNIRSITEILMATPMRAGGDLMAGPPFEMPYSLTLADRDADRWRTHRDLILASQQYVDELERYDGGDHEVYLKGLRGANESALEQVLMLIGG